MAKRRRVQKQPVAPKPDLQTLIFVLIVCKIFGIDPAVLANLIPLFI